MLYPTELLRLIQKIFNFRLQPDSNELPLRRRTLYPTELRRQKVFSTFLVYYFTLGLSISAPQRQVMPRESGGKGKKMCTPSFLSKEKVI